MNSLRDLQVWYAAHCDGDWEHVSGVRIASLDNPGWSLQVDLEGTELEHRLFDPVVDEGHQRWVHMKVTKSVWQGACDPLGLERMIEAFLAWARRGE